MKVISIPSQNADDDNTPELNTKDTLAQMEVGPIEVDIAGESQISGLNSALRQLRSNAMPKDLVKQYEKCWALRDEDDLVGTIIDTQMEFGLDGVQIYSPSGSSKTHYDKINETFDMEGQIIQMWESLATTSNIVLHWKMSGSKIDYISVLRPEMIEVQPTFNNKSLLFVRVPKHIEDMVRDKARLSPEERKALSEIPKKWVEAAEGRGKKSRFGNHNMVALSEKDGEYWIIANEKGFSDRLVTPSMKKVFDSVENRNMLIDGDYSVAYFIKNLIMHVTTGESITQGPKAGSTQNFAKKKHLTALKSKFKTTGKAMSLFTGHLVNVNFLLPDVKAFDPIKFSAPDTRILTWGGIGEVVLNGKGGNYAAGFINLKRLIAKVKRHRGIISKVLNKFYKHPTIKGRISEKNTPELFFDDELLKEAKISLDESKFLIDRGAISLETYIRKRGYNPDIENKNKDNEMKNLTTWLPKLTSLQPITVALEGNSNNPSSEDGEPGRPGNTQPSHGETTLNTPQNPRPSTASSGIDMADILERKTNDQWRKYRKGMPEEARDLYWEVEDWYTMNDWDNWFRAENQAWAAVNTLYEYKNRIWVRRDLNHESLPDEIKQVFKEAQEKMLESGASDDFALVFGWNAVRKDYKKNDNDEWVLR